MTARRLLAQVRATEGVTPFMLACKAAHFECATLLARAGADVEAANHRGGSALVVACVMGHVDTVRLLLTLGANADARTVAVDDSEQLFQCRPLMTACRYNQPKVVGALLAAGVSVEAMENALVELEAFPTHKECLHLVRRALGRKGGGGAAKGGAEGVATAAAAADAARLDAEARAEAAMAELIAEEEQGGGKAKKKKRQKKKGGNKGVAPVEPSSPVPVEAQAGAEAEAAAASLAADTEKEPAVPFRLPASVDERHPPPKRESDMNALASEFRSYQQRQQARGAQVEEARTAPSHAARLGDDPHAEEVAAAPASLSPGTDSVSSSEGSAASAVSDAQKQIDYEQLDTIVQRSRASRDLSQVDVFLHRKKFTTDSISFFLTRVREGARERELELKAAREPDNVAAVTPGKAAATTPPGATELEAGKAAADGPTAATADRTMEAPASRPASVDVRDDIKEEEDVSPLSAAQRRRKARRPPPPADLLSSPLPRKEAKDGGSAKGQGMSQERLGSRTFSELERRLEEELLVAREREAALHAALQQRTQALSDLALCPITHEPMVDPVMTADGQTYERTAIEAWLQRCTGEDGHTLPTSPLTGEPLKDTTLRPNYLARELGYAAVAN